jgi:hypothetical protein
MENEPKVTDVPGQIFEKFLKELKSANVADEVIERLRVALLTDRNITEANLKSAIFLNQPES